MKLPTCVIGFIRGIVRRERCGGADVVSVYGGNYFLFMKPPVQVFPDETMFAITHLQKKSKFGFLLMSHEKWWQLCFHIWYTFKYQEQIMSDGNVLVDVPGSEKVLYWRVGYSRWDAGDCKYVSGWTISISAFGKKFSFTIPFGTWYGPGLHWD